MRRRAAVDVFRFRDYRDFLRAYHERGGASLRELGRQSGLRSPNYWKLVMDGARNLTPELAIRFGEAAQLSGQALEFFCALVAFNQAKTARARELAYTRLQSFARYRKVHVLDAAQQAYHSEWYLPAIRELAAREDFRDDPKWIAKTLLPSISPAQAKRALSLLHKLKLLVRDRALGRSVITTPLLATPDRPLGHHVQTFHRTMMTLASEALDRVPREEREIASLTLCLSEQQLEALKAELEALRRALLERYYARPDATRVVQLNLQMFPLSKREV